VVGFVEERAECGWEGVGCGGGRVAVDEADQGHTLTIWGVARGLGVSQAVEDTEVLVGDGSTVEEADDMLAPRRQLLLREFGAGCFGLLETPFDQDDDR
jgi:hypothetical protein